MRRARPGWVTAESVWKEYEKGLAFKAQIGLFETVRVNENFFIGKQWEGVASNGLPTPVFISSSASCCLRCRALRRAQ